MVPSWKAAVHPPEPPKISSGRWLRLGVQGLPETITRPYQLPPLSTIVVQGRGAPQGGYVIAPYNEQISPRSEHPEPGKVEAHHGVFTEIVGTIIPNASEGEAPTVLMVKEQHRETVRIWEGFKAEVIAQRLLPTKVEGTTRVIDWFKVPEETKLWLSDKVMELVGVPQQVRDTYFKEFELYRANKEAQAQFQEYESQVSTYQQQVQELREPPPKSEP
jgi:hypothetical protein